MYIQNLLISKDISMIASLKLGYIDGKCFSTSEISEFLGIEAQEVIDITRTVLLAYKERINQIIDGAIQIFTEVITSVNNENKQYNLNKIYVMLQEMKNAIVKQDTEIFLIKYKNLVEELNNLWYNAY